MRSDGSGGESGASIVEECPEPSGARTVFATDRIKVASGDLTPHAGRALKPSKYGNSGRYGTSWITMFIDLFSVLIDSIKWWMGCCLRYSLWRSLMKLRTSG